MRALAGYIIALLALVSFGLAHAQIDQGLAASTDKQSYQPGDRVVISGTIKQPTDDNPVTIIVRNPIGNVYEVGQVPLVDNGFSHNFVLSSDAKNGNYTVIARQGGMTSQFQFQVMPGQVQIIPVLDGEIRSTGTYASLIKYGTAQVSVAENSITIPVDTTKIQNNTVTEEYRVPKHVIDSTYGLLVVKENGIVVDCTQSEADGERVLDCPVNKGTYSMTLVGTSVIPEFGPVAGLALAVGLSTMAIFSRFMACPCMR